MNFVNRLTYFSGGFIIGLLFLMFFLSGKRTSCNYLPDARVKKDILKKTMIFIDHNSKKDSIIIMNTISRGKVDFSKSNTSLEDCKEYYIEDEDKMNKIWVIIKNCKNTAEIYDYKISKN
tara:strand:- start:7864 stop:8223 length:360 start_codon:yes stop_codon:yes gene_type:complete